MAVTEPEHEHWVLRITGRVQGVFFRKSAKIEGQRLGIAVVAENLADGSVRIEARGDPAALTAFSRWCETGPADANVSAVRIEKRE